MTPVRWLLARRGDPPREDGWLSGAERIALARLNVPKRREEWLLGRWAAKRAVVAAGEAAREEEVAVLPSFSGAPDLLVSGRASALALSLTHGHGVAVAALAPAPARLGVDLEKVEPRPASFLADWFTEREQALVGAAGEDASALAATLVWSAKESVMKALREGLRIPPRSVEIAPASGAADGSWRSFAARGPSAEERWTGWWRAEEGLVLTVVASPAPGPPERIG